MHSVIRTSLLTALLGAAPAVMYAQVDFTVDGRQVQVHSFASQGFMYSNNNNYLSLNTSQGSFAFTDFGINASTQLTDKFHVGVEMYDRNLGHLGDWKPSLDWAVADYRFKDWLGLRGGKVKTVLGLHNDTQDLSFLYTWALMPASVYPLDARSDNIAHLGGDIYGNVSLKKLGQATYTVYGGQRPNDPDSGSVYGLETSSLLNGQYIISIGKTINNMSGPECGADLRWTTPLKGLQAGASYLTRTMTVQGTYLTNNRPYIQNLTYDKITATYVEYTASGFIFDGEYRMEPQRANYDTSTGVQSFTTKDTRQGYVSASYRISKWLELGAYYSRYYKNWAANHGDPANHIFDQAISGRVDLKKYLDLKIEGHFMDGAMIDSSLSRGFFAISNPNGIKPQMRLFVLKLEYHM